MTQAWLEKRQFIRITANYEVQYASLPSEEAEAMKTNAGYKRVTDPALDRLPVTPKLKAFTQDISSGGLALVAHENLPLGTYLLLDIFCPSLPKPVRALCLVMRAENPQPNGQIKMGLQTVAINQDDLRNLERALAG